MNGIVSYNLICFTVFTVVAYISGFVYSLNKRVAIIIGMLAACFFIVGVILTSDKIFQSVFIWYKYIGSIMGGFCWSMTFRGGAQAGDNFKRD